MWWPLVSFDHNLPRFFSSNDCRSVKKWIRIDAIRDSYMSQYWHDLWDLPKRSRRVISSDPLWRLETIKFFTKVTVFLYQFYLFFTLVWSQFSPDSRQIHPKPTEFWMKVLFFFSKTCSKCWWSRKIGIQQKP